MVAQKRAKVKRKKVAIKKSKSTKKTAKKTSKRTTKKATKKRSIARPAVQKKAAKKTVRSRPVKAVKKKKKASNTSIRAKATGKKTGAKKKAVSSRHVRAAKKRWRDQRKREKQIRQSIKAATQRQLDAHPELAGIVDSFKQQLDAETKKAFQAGIRKGLKQSIDKEREKYSKAYIRARELMEAERTAFMAKMEASNELFEQWVETDESKAIARLMLADQYGELEQEAEAIAEEYDWDIREVYDLFFETP